MKVYGQIYRNTPYDEATKLYGIYEVSQFYITHTLKNDDVEGNAYCICFVTLDGGEYYIRSEQGAGYPLYLANNIIQDMLSYDHVALDQYYMKVFDSNYSNDMEDPQE